MATDEDWAERAVSHLRPHPDFWSGPPEWKEGDPEPTTMATIQISPDEAIEIIKDQAGRIGDMEAEIARLQARVKMLEFQRNHLDAPKIVGQAETIRKLMFGFNMVAPPEDMPDGFQAAE